MPCSSFAHLSPRLCLILLVAVTVFPGAASVRASTFELDLRPYDGLNLVCSAGSLDQQTDTAPVEASVTDEIHDVVSNSVGNYAARAERGIVQMRMNVNHRVNGSFNRLFGSCSDVRELIDDIVVTGPPGAVTAELNANLFGKLAIDSLSTRSDLSVTVALTALDGGGNERDASTNTVVLDLDVDADIAQAISSGPVTFQVGDTLVAELRINMTLVSAYVSGVTVSNSFDFLDEPSNFGLHFSYDNVLSLPPGYTSSSTDGDIGNNRWRGTVPAVTRSWGELKSRYR